MFKGESSRAGLAWLEAGHRNVARARTQRTLVPATASSNLPGSGRDGVFRLTSPGRIVREVATVPMEQPCQGRESRTSPGPDDGGRLRQQSWVYRAKGNADGIFDRIYTYGVGVPGVRGFWNHGTPAWFMHKVLRAARKVFHNRTAGTVGKERSSSIARQTAASNVSRWKEDDSMSPSFQSTPYSIHWTALVTEQRFEIGGCFNLSATGYSSATSRHQWFAHHSFGARQGFPQSYPRRMSNRLMTIMG
ncbi:hypothetical protein E4U57_007290 [Claviceps arundinis]|uniref:Uncharacterized protein n=1 Tax=Claviceps arundinis TaxID=1623583 RepID=A0ABQ7PFL3_9HYPO|nr:hypothetical protein E4U57_007290 [Claviceps arundinis]